MAEIKLDRENSMKVLNNPDAAPGALLIAACAMALFTCNDAEDTDAATRHIAHKVLRMAAAALDDAAQRAEDNANG